MNIESRLMTLERGMRRSRRLNYLLLGFILLTGLYGFRKNQALEDLQVRSISIVDDNGKIYAKIAKGDNGGWMSLYNSSGTSVAGIQSGSNNAGSSWFCNSAGSVRRWMTVDADGASDYFYNSYGKPSISLYNDNNGYGQFKSYDNNERQMAFIGGSSNGGGGISLSNNNNKFTAYLGGSNGTLRLYDYDGVNMANIFSNSENGDSYLELANTYGKRNIYLGGGKYDHKGYLYTSDGYNYTGTFPH